MVPHEITNASHPSLASPLGKRLVVCLGLGQLITWGTMHYLIAVFGSAMARDLGWSTALVQSGFSLALVVMGASSTIAGRWINAGGGRVPLIAGCWTGAAGCALLAMSHSPLTYFAGWALLGIGMRLSLYDAAFAALAYLGGTASKRAMSQITLFGGLASTIFWPLGQGIADQLGWRVALCVYACILVLGSGVHLAIPKSAARTFVPERDSLLTKSHLAGADSRVDKWLYGGVVILLMVMQTGVAAHFIELIRGLGWDPRRAVMLSTLLGVGQFTGRLWFVAWGYRYNAIKINLLPSSLLAVTYVTALAAGSHFYAAAAFAFLYGFGNGMATITRGAMPLLLFDPASYGRIVGAILKPAFLLAAASPIAVALCLEVWGHTATLQLLLAVSLVLVIASAALALRHRNDRGTEYKPKIAESSPPTKRN